jgi:hypothetical protein
MQLISFAGTGHGDPVAAVVLSLAIILVAAKLGGDLATRIGQPAVLGELVMGVTLGNLSFVGMSSLDYIKGDTSGSQMEPRTTIRNGRLGRGFGRYTPLGRGRFLDCMTQSESGKHVSRSWLSCVHGDISTLPNLRTASIIGWCIVAR